ncbi:MAG: hypothetical protein JOZ22_05760, partial [Acidobacteriia bacterium]|nr:hypothetical protein [Terriglobia bacterium]
MDIDGETKRTEQPEGLSNAEIADCLASLAQLLSADKENPYKVKAYRSAAARIRTFAESLDEMVRDEADLTRFAGIGEGIAAAIREIVLTGTLGKLEKLRAETTPALADLSAHPRLDPKRVMRIYKKLGIASVEELKARLESGAIEKALGPRLAQHVRQGVTETHAMLLYHADHLRDAIEAFLVGPCKGLRAEAAGDYRRRVDVIEELVFVVDTDDFAGVISRLQRYGGRTPLLAAQPETASFALSSGIRLRLQLATKKDWGFHMVACTGSKAHLRKLTAVTGSLRQLKADSFPTETALYRKFGLSFIDPELREGRDEVRQAKAGQLPNLVMRADIRGELHAHTSASDGSDSIEAMADAARKRGYDYVGI